MDLVGSILLQVHRLLPDGFTAAGELLERVRPIADGRPDFALAHAAHSLAAGDAASAKVSLSAAMGSEAHRREALRLLARLAVIEHGPGAGTSFCLAALILDPSDPGSYNDLANRLIDSDRPMARRLLNQALTIQPDLPEAHLNQAVIAERDLRWDDVHRWATAALRLEPGSVAARICMAKVVGRDTWTPQTQELLSTALALDPANPVALNALGITALAGTDQVEAARWFNRALHVNKRYRDTLFNLGALYQTQGRTEAALALYDRLQDSSSDLALYNAGLLLLRERKFDLAVARLLRAARLNPENPDIYPLLGTALAETGRSDQADAVQQFAIALAPGDSQQYYNLGLLAQNREQYPISFRAYMRSLRIDPTMAAAYSNIGAGLTAMGKNVDAIACFKSAITFDPMLPSAYFNLGVAYQGAGEPEEGLRWYDRALNLRPDEAEPYIDIGISLLHEGDTKQAAAYIRRGLTMDPALPRGLSCYGNVHLNRKEFPVAGVWFKRALRIDTDYALALNNLGTTLIDQRRFAAAAKLFKHVLELTPDYSRGWYNLGNALRDQGLLDAAVISGQRAVSLEPDYVDAHNNLGLVLNLSGRMDEALKSYENALGCVKPTASLLNNLGNLCHRLHRTDEAIANYRKALEIDPEYFLAIYNLGCAYQQAEDFASCVVHFRRALELRPDHVSSLYNLACGIHHQHEFQEVLGVYESVLALEPTHYRAANNLASTLQSLGRQRQSLAWYNRAQALAAAATPGNQPELESLSRPDDEFLEETGAAAGGNERIALADNQPSGLSKAAPMFPAALWNKGLLLLSMGRLRDGWDGYEYRWSSNVMGEGAMRTLRQPQWDGRRDITGKRLLVWREQGIGDEIMFANSIRDLGRTGAKVTFECSKKLIPLFTRSFPDVQVVLQDRENDDARGDLDFHLPIGSLPRIFRQDVSQFPTRSNFLRPNPVRVAYWRQRLEQLGPGPYIGICWRGRVRTVTRNHHYTRIEDWGPVLTGRRCTFINMQYDEASEEVAVAQEMFGTRIHSIADIDMWDDLDDVAALLGAQDLLITAGTAVMSLAGGLGVPTWLMWVDNVENWPTLGTNHLPWYPSIELFPRTLTQNWGEITARIGARLDRVLEDLPGFLGGRPLPDYKTGIGQGEYP